MEAFKPVSARRREVRRLTLSVRSVSRLPGGLEDKVMKMSMSDPHSSLHNYDHLLAPLLKEKDIS